MTLYRRISILRRRVRNRLSCYVNRVRLRAYGISYGRNCMVAGPLGIRLFDTARVSIGDNLYCSNGWNINALSSNRRGSLYATDNAVIEIGNNVGISSATIWCHNHVRIGDNVKIGANTIVIDTDAHSLDFSKRRSPMTDGGAALPVEIGDDVLIGVNCLILKGVKIGERSVIGGGFGGHSRHPRRQHSLRQPCKGRPHQSTPHRLKICQ